MKLRLYQIDAFAEQVFQGNPAAVCLLESWLPDEVLQQIAQENQLSETAYIVHAHAHTYHIRWFTPQVEVDLCGHATLASAFVLFELQGVGYKRLCFHSRSGVLEVERQGKDFVLNFPQSKPVQCDISDDISLALGKAPRELWKSDDYLAVYEHEADIVALSPDFSALKRLDGRGVIVTAPGQQVDMVSRFFAPRCGIDEDPVTGSAHCTLAPYWAEKLGKHKLTAQQLSHRGGSLQCEVKQGRVYISGRACKYLEGYIEV